MSLKNLLAARWTALLVMSLPTVLPDSSRAQSLEQAFSIVQQAVEDGSIPGAAVLIMQDGEVIAEKTFGLCEISAGRPFRMDTICWVASLTKPVTATAAMKLVERGKLDLDAPVVNYLPVLAQLATQDGRKQSVTIRHLMSHSSGIPASVPLRPSFFFTQEWFDRSLSEVVDAIAARPLDFVPGSRAEYSNAAPYVLGRIVEVVSGQPFGQFVRNEVLGPLDMHDTGFEVAPAKCERTAVVYRREQGKLSIYCQYDPAWDVRMTMPDGGLFSTPKDIAQFANSFLNPASQLLQPESIQSMLTKQNESFGLGWIRDREHQFSHWGSSGTLVWADQKSKVVGVFFSQIQDFELLASLRESFRSEVDRAFQN